MTMKERENTVWTAKREGKRREAMGGKVGR
jgi:hypothetical protein